MAQPNVIVFFTDQQRWDTTGVHGNPLNLTPSFDRMARHRHTLGVGEQLNEIWCRLGEPDHDCAVIGRADAER